MLSETALLVVRAEHNRAVLTHGPLKPGLERWIRLLSEEWEEATDELSLLHALILHNPEQPPAILSAIQQAKSTAVAELAQVAQLAIGIIELIQAGSIQEE